MERFIYGMRLRGFSLGAQPMDGFLRRRDDWRGLYFDILEYDRPLTEREIKRYELAFLGVVEE